MLVHSDGNQAEIPLKHVKISGSICGFHGELNISQTYKNHTPKSIEVIYTFPLPDSSTVTGFTAHAGDRTINSEVREKEEAFQIYDEALRKGDSAYLLEQYRPNIFQISLGQISPEEEVQVSISYLDTIKYQDGEMSLAIPTLVAPRYIPGKPAGKRRGMGVIGPTHRVPDADFVTPPVKDVDYKVELDLLIDPLINIDQFNSPSHQITATPEKENKTRINFTPGQVPLDRDIIINCKGKEETSAGTLTCQGRDDNIIYLNLLPELEAYQEEETSKNYIFLMDISGSMGGKKIEQAKNALQLCIRNLTQKDTFNIVAFESTTHYFSERGSLPFNHKNLEKATRWINALYPMGGTEILKALQFSLQTSSPKDTIIMLFTDGQVGNEKEILQYTKRHIRQNKIYTFGIDTAVNSFLINSLAQEGSGLAEYIYPGERIEDKVLRQFARITSPGVSSIKLDWGNLEIKEIFPPEIKQIFNLEPLTVLAKYRGDLEGEVTLSGKVNEENFSTSLDLSRAAKGDTSLLEKLWARMKIDSMEESLSNINPRREQAVIQEIVNLAREYKISSPYTSFVAVEERPDRASGIPETIVVPVSPPAEWMHYEDHITNLMMPSSLREEDSCDMNYLRRISNYNMEEEHHIRLSGSEDSGETLEKAIRYLALKQQAEGSFADSIEDDLLEKLKTTALSLLSFLLAPEEIGLYKKQLLKSIDFLTGSAGDHEWEQACKKHRQAHYLTALALKVLLNKKIAKGKTKERAEVLFDYLLSFYHREKAPLLFAESVSGISLVHEIYRTLNLEPFTEPDIEAEYADVMELSLLCLFLATLE